MVRCVPRQQAGARTSKRVRIRLPSLSSTPTRPPVENSWGEGQVMADTVAGAMRSTPTISWRGGRGFKGLKGWGAGGLGVEREGVGELNFPDAIITNGLRSDFEVC